MGHRAVIVDLVLVINCLYLHKIDNRKFRIEQYLKKNTSYAVLYIQREGKAVVGALEQWSSVGHQLCVPILVRQQREMKIERHFHFKNTKLYVPGTPEGVGKLLVGPRAEKAGGKGSSGPGNAILSSSGMMKKVMNIFWLDNVTCPCMLTL